jgi:hypothetical protein
VLEEHMSSLAAAGFQTENVMVCFKEAAWENCSFGGGRFIHIQGTTDWFPRPSGSTPGRLRESFP